MGFELNTHDPCVANKIINGQQCTIAWYVDDNKISHVDSAVVDQLIEKIEEKFGKMTVKRGKQHVFVGMDIDFIGEGKVKITMKDHLREAIEAFGEDVTIGATTPATRSLFEVNEDLTQLEPKKAKLFHHIVCKTFVCLKTR